MRLDPRSDSALDGRVLAGRFRVEQKLGEGGMGVVFECTHLVLGNRVVIKVLKSSSGVDAEARARFLREGRAAALLESPHIVRVLDAGTLESGEPFLCMEKLRGHDLARELVVRGGTLPIAEALEYVGQAAKALQLAHEAGIVHRDIKPANLFLSETESGSRCVKVLDFGIAKARSLGKDELATTSLGSVLGTPYYMSPEQLRSSRGVTGQTDVWSLGVVLHELVTGTLPFRGETIASLSAAILTEPLDVRAIERLGNHRLTSIVSRALDKDLSRRFATMNDLLIDLARARDSQAPEAFASTAVDIPRSLPLAGSKTPAPRGSRSATYLGVSMLAISAVSMAAFIGRLSHGSEAPQAARLLEEVPLELPPPPPAPKPPCSRSTTPCRKPARRVRRGRVASRTNRRQPPARSRRRNQPRLPRSPRLFRPSTSHRRASPLPRHRAAAAS
jgi:serine/threonine-protein kinase